MVFPSGDTVAESIQPKPVQMKISKERKQLLLKLESLVGNQCYNANIQNWGPNGVFEGEGREFRYPVTFISEDGEKLKRSYRDDTITAEAVLSGYYAFGANQLHIMKGLNKVLAYLEESHGLKL